MTVEYAQGVLEDLKDAVQTGMPDPEKTEICEALQIAMTIVENRTSSFITDRIEFGSDGNPYRMTVTDGSEYYMPERVFTKDEVKKKEKAAYDKGYKDGYNATQDERGDIE